MISVASRQQPSPPKSWVARRLRFVASAGLVLSLLGAVAADNGVAHAQTAHAQTAPTEAAGAELARQLQESYEILPLQGASGLALIPLQPPPGVRSIRLQGDEIRVNDALVPPAALRAWLREDADLLLRLAALPPAARLQLLGFPVPEDGASSTPPLEPRVDVPEESQVEPRVESPVEPRVDVSGDDATVPATDIPAEEPGAVPELEIREVPDDEGESTVQFNSDTRLGLGNPLTIDEDEVAQEVVGFGGPVSVLGRVRGDVVSFGGPVRISGQVDGDISSFGGPVYLEETAVVYGDIVSLGGTVQREEGAQFYGEVTGLEVGADRFRFGDWDNFDFDFVPWGPWWWWGSDEADIADGIGHIVLLAILVCLVLALVRSRVEEIRLAIVEDAWRAGFLGILATGLFLFASLVLLVSIIGWPVLIFAILAYILFAVVGYATVAYQLGLYLERRFGWRVGSYYLVGVLGVLLIQGWSLASDILDLAGWPLLIFSVVLGIFGFLAQLAAWMVGIGGVVLSRTQRETVLSAVPVPPPPPGTPPSYPSSPAAGYSPSPAADYPPSYSASDTASHPADSASTAPADTPHGPAADLPAVPPRDDPDERDTT